MDDEEPQMFCRDCWNPVERIHYQEEGKRTPGGVENVWKHSKFAPHPPTCGKSPITDEDVVTERDLP